MMKKLILALILLLFGTGTKLAAAEVTFSADAPKQVVMGENFNLVYSSNTDIEELRIPELNDFFEILFGPSSSMSSYTANINGRYESKTSYSYTYVLKPRKTGTFTIPGAQATIKGGKIKCNNLSIKVLPADQPSGGNTQRRAAQNNGYDAQNEGNQSSSTSVGNDQIFIRAIPSKTIVNEQEAILVTYKLFTRTDISGMQNSKFPEFKGFMVQEIPSPQNIQWDMENVNGQNYRTAVLKQNILYPRQTGTQTIDRGSFDFVLRVRNRNTRARSIFDDFFDTYSEVKKTINCNPLKITVKPFPAGKPADFSGVAGNLSLSSSISRSKVKANESITIKLKISGNGNLKMIPTPEMTFPADFETYDPKVDNAFKTTTSGVSGTKTIDYLVIPRFAGTFQIPAVSLSYFDLATHSYKTLKSQPFTIEVAKGDGSSANVSGNFANQEQLRLLRSDIRYLKTGFKVEKQAPLFFGTLVYWLWYMIPAFLFGLLLILNRKKLKDNADIARVRNRKANRVAVKRLKQAAVFLKAGKQEAFYDEVLKALWGYTSDKLNIPLSRLDKENIENQLSECNVSEDIRKEFMDILQDCEFARFAPGDPAAAMDKMYDQTLEVINKMENTIKR